MQYFRCRKPSKGQRRHWTVQVRENGKWCSMGSPELDAINQSFTENILSFNQAYERVKRLIDGYRAIRDADLVHVAVSIGNQAVLDAFIEKTYTPQKLLRMGKESFNSAKYMLERALKDIGDIPVDGDANLLQQTIDDKFKGSPGSHTKRITAINRIRKFRSLSLLLHLNGNAEDVQYITEEQLTNMLVLLEPFPVTRILAGFLFYTGLRTGEAFAVTSQSIRRQGGATLVMVTRQMWRDLTYGPTKTRSTRKAFVIPGGEKIVEEWARVENKELQRMVSHNKRIKRAAKKLGVKDFYAHCLRHSYCVHLIGKGCTIDWVAKAAGHSRAVCERYYSTFSLTDDAITLMQGLLAPKAG